MIMTSRLCFSKAGARDKKHMETHAGGAAETNQERHLGYAQKGQNEELASLEKIVKF